MRQDIENCIDDDDIIQHRWEGVIGFPTIVNWFSAKL
jgi:hypothetical protein